MSVSTSHRPAERHVWAELAPFVQPSLAFLLALVVVLLLTGRIVPVSSLAREVEAERRRCDDLRARLDAADARADRLTDYLHQLMPYARVTGELVTEMRRAVESAPAQAMDGRDPA